MRDLVAGLIALFLLAVALSLATALRLYRLRRQNAHDSERALGRTVIAELPTGPELVLFSEDGVRFYYGERTIDKDLIRAVRVLVNGSPMAADVSRSAPPASRPPPASQGGHGGPPLQQIVGAAPRGGPTGIEDRPDGISRDRWDVEIATETGDVLVECGAIRERVSQELARRIFEAVKKVIKDEVIKEEVIKEEGR